MFYVAAGNVPHKRHTQHRAPDGSLYSGGAVRGRGLRRPELAPLPPGRADHGRTGSRPAPAIDLAEADDGVHRHRLIKTGSLAAAGDAVSGRIPLFFNPT